MVSSVFKILDRYILREIVPPFLLGLLVFTFILLIPPLMDVAESLIAKGVGGWTILRLMMTLLPQALGITLPMSLLIGLLIAFGRLSGDREAVAIQACGISPRRLLRPVLFMAGITAVITNYVLVSALPDANQTFREITYSVIASRTQDEVKPRVFYEDFPNIILYIRDASVDGQVWHDVFLADTRNPARPEIFVASQGRMLLNKEQRQVSIMLTSGARHEVAPDMPEEYEIHEFERMVMALDPETVFPEIGPERGYPELTISELKVESERLRDAGESPHRPIMEIHKKFSIPFACFVFAFIGLGLGVSHRKDGRLASFVLAIGVIFSYYVVMYIGEALAKGGQVSPHLAMWLPNILLGIPGVLLLYGRQTNTERLGSLRLALFLKRILASFARPLLKLRGKRSTHTPRRFELLTFKLNLLDRYITRHYLGVVGLSFFGLIGIFYVATFIDLSDKLFKGQTSSGALLEYFWFATPQYVYYVLPISVLIATLVTIGLLTKSSELTVMKACGISTYRTAAPLILCGVIGSALLFGIGETILGSANQRAEAIRHVIRGGSPQTFDVLNRKWFVAPDGSIYHYAYLDPDLKEIHGLSKYEFGSQQWALAKRTFINRASFNGDWEGTSIWVRQFDNEFNLMPYTTTEQGRLSLEPPEFFVTEQPDAERMSYRELERYIAELRTSGFNVVQLTVDMQRKLSFPFVTVVMTLIAVPFGVLGGKRGAMYGVGVGLILAIVYWVTISIFGAIGSAGLLTPVLAAWAPNILFCAGAGYLLLSVRT